MGLYGKRKTVVFKLSHKIAVLMVNINLCFWFDRF